MNKTIYFIRTGPYKYQIDNLNLYQSFNAVAKKILEVPLTQNAKQYFKRNVPENITNIKTVYCSSRQRSLQTANFISSKVKILPELVEVGFFMEDFINEKDFYNKLGNPNVQKARKGFVNALINDHLQENFQDVLKRIDKLFKIFQKESADQIVIFSHGFFMKIIEAYIRNPTIKNDPNKLLKYFDGSTETFKFCEGFILEFDNKNFYFKTYIRNKETYGY